MKTVFVVLMIGLAAASSALPTLGASANKNSKLRILQIGVGGIGGIGDYLVTTTSIYPIHKRTVGDGCLD